MHSYAITFLLQSLLLLVIQLAALIDQSDLSNEIEKQVRPHWKHAMKYEYGDYRPHFGYHRGHMATDHKFRKHRRPIYPLTHKRWHPWIPAKPKTMGKPKKESEVKIRNRLMVMMRSGANPMTLPESNWHNPIDFVVQIYTDDKYLCAGTLIDDRTVITAANCHNPNELTVHTKDGKTYRAESDSEKKKFKYGPNKGLIELITLKEPLDTSIKAPQLCESTLRPGSNVTIATWHETEKNVLARETNIISGDECKEMYDDPSGKVISLSSICALDNEVTDSCKNVIGLPLFSGGKLCGVNIMGHNCPDKHDADVFVYVVHTTKFIRNSLRYIKRSGLSDILS